MTVYTPAVGDRVRVTRYRPDSTVQAVKTGVIRGADATGFVFEDDVYGIRPLAGTALFAEGMRGWRQTIEPA
jgi:hypothetical protein